MKTPIIFSFFIILLVFSGCKKKDHHNESQPEIRHFLMGFTPFPYEISQQAVDNTYQNIIRDGDMVLAHFDNGILWNEALNDLPFPGNVQYEINQIVTRIPPDHKIFLTTTPNHTDRETLAHYWNDNRTQQNLPSPWNTYSFNHPDVITAYINVSG